MAARRRPNQTFAICQVYVYNLATSSMRISLFSWVAFGFSIILFAFVLGTSPINGVLGLVASLGPSILLAPLPYLGVIALEVAGWKTILGSLEQPVSFTRLLHIRLAVEAVARAIPGGAIGVEGLKLYLVSTHCEVPPSKAAVSLSVLKILVVATHALYLASGVAVSASRDLHAAGGQMPLLPAGAAVGLLLLSISAWALLVRGSAGQSLQLLLMRFPSARLRSWVLARETEFRSFDQLLRGLWSKSKGAVLIASMLLLMSWFGETVETLVMARLLGAHFSLAELFPLESRVSILRAIAFFLPGALGVQDAGYMAFLQNTGINNVTAFAGAFILVKRARDICWIVTSVFLLIILRSSSLAARQFRRSSS